LSGIELIRGGWRADNLLCVRNFKDLKVWERSHRLVLDVYDATGSFPSEETFGLTAQLRRCCASIPANIAEGCGRSGEAELARFMLISMGSTSELEYHLLLARDLGYLSAKHYQELLQEVSEVKRMLSTFITKLRHTKKLKS
jgi:four helix bundle protein